MSTLWSHCLCVLLVGMLLICGHGACGAAIYEPTLKVGAFNVRVFGQSKIQDTVVMERLVKILSRYDLVFFQEIRDIAETAIYVLKDELNIANLDDPFDMNLSERLGTTDSKEQYAFFYRPSKVTLTDTHLWDDPSGVYERAPYVGRFAFNLTEEVDFGFIGVHTKPLEAPSEIDGLVDVYDGMTQFWGLKDFILGGDWNAGCRYVTGKEWERVRLRHDLRFQWLIDDDTDTMITSDCPYDRFVLAGDGMLESYVNNSVSVYRFDEDMGLTLEEAEDVSDHYPIELSLR